MLGVDNDWQLLSKERMWCGWVLVIIHLIARGLQQALAAAVSLVGKLTKCCHRKGVVVVSWALVFLSLPFLCVCSGVSLLCVLVAFAFRVSSECWIHMICPQKRISSFPHFRSPLLYLVMLCACCCVSSS